MTTNSKLTQAQACMLLKKTPSQFRKLVSRGLITQQKRGAKPAVYDKDEVLDLRYSYDTLGEFTPSSLAMNALIAKTNRLEQDVRLLMRIQGLERTRLILKTVEEAYIFYEDVVTNLIKEGRYDLNDVAGWADVLLRLDEPALIRIHQATGEPFPPKVFYQMAKRLYMELENMELTGAESKKDIAGAEKEVTLAHRHVLGLCAMFAELDLHTELRDAIRQRLDDVEETNREVADRIKGGKK